jgi:2-polyprenyl-3-methyl-5-hydroxy-6-metoxy-1,4-benzoquinol methylase
MACTTTLDTQRAEAFAGRMLELVNGGALTLMISIGHRTGLFDAMAGQPGATSAEIAGRAGLNERYVREWLGAMVTGRVVECDPDEGTYTLPPEHGAWLTRSASPDNFAVTAQFIPLLGAVEDEIVECFSKGGGVPYSSYGRFHQIMAEESNQTVVAGLEEHILPLVPGLVDRLERGISVLDVGCGSGYAINWLARRFPASRFRGYDFEPDAIVAARREATSPNAEFRVQDVSLIDEPGRYDLVTAFDAIHDQAKPAEVLAAIRRALKDDGVFLMQDIKGFTPHHKNLDNPVAPLMYTISCMHCMTVSLANGGAGLGAMWGREKAEEMLADAGFARVEVSEMPHDILNLWYVARR